MESTTLNSKLYNIKKHFNNDSIRAATILHWAKINVISHSSLNKSRIITSFIDVLDRNTEKDLLSLFNKEFNALSIKDIENIFESLMNSNERKSRGAVYTPDYIIDYLLSNSIKFSMRNKNSIPSVCDPSCGSGGFLIIAAKILKQAYNVPIDKAFNEHIVGLDIDDFAIKNATALIELYLLLNKINPNKIKMKLFNIDSLLEKTGNILDKTGFHSGFSVVATNPPYVKIQNLEEQYRNLLINKYKAFTSGSFSLAPLFLIAGHKLLAPNGCLAYITQNNLFTSLSGKYVRKYLQETRCIKRIIDFGHQKIFNNASAYTCLIFLDTKEHSCFEFETIRKSASLDKLNRAQFDNIYFDKLNYKKWRLAKGKHLINLRKIEQVGTPLGSLTNIRVGFATLKDKIYMIRRENNHFIANPFNGEKYHIEADITKPAIKIADLQSENDIEVKSNYMIFPYYKLDNNFILIPEEDLVSKYPLTYKYLLSCKEMLGSRNKGKNISEGWYAWGRRQGLEAAGPKLLTKTFNSSPQFYLDTSDRLFCNGYGIFPKKDTLLTKQIPIKVLQLILNSKIMHYYVKLTSFQIDGNYQCYQKNFIEKFGIVEIDTSTQNELLKLQSKDIDKYLAKLYQLSIDDIFEIIDEY